MQARLSTRAIGWCIPLLAEAAALARSAILARMIGGEELGRAMVLTLVLRLGEMVSDVGIERLLMQRPGPLPPGLIDTLHGASQQQSDAVQRIAHSVGLIDQNTQSNAALAEQSAASAESLHQQAQRLIALVATFRTQHPSRTLALGRH